MGVGHAVASSIDDGNGFNRRINGSAVRYVTTISVTNYYYFEDDAQSLYLDVLY